MSTDPHKPVTGLPEHSDVAFEGRDISISSVLWSLVYLAVTVLISLVICVYFFKYATQYVASQDTPPPMIRQQMSDKDSREMSMAPEPRLQGVPGHENDAQQDLRDKNAADAKENESARWIDEKTGIAQIPVSEAMKIIAEKGLPVFPPPAPEKKKITK
jgi:hypothetical protein